MQGDKTEIVAEEEDGAGSEGQHEPPSEPHPFAVPSRQEPELQLYPRDHRPPAKTSEIAAEHDDSDILLQQFVREAACERIVVTQLKSIWNEIQAGSASETDLKEAVGDALVKALGEHARKECDRRIRESNDAISTLEQSTHAAGKFADPEASFGDEEDFHAGLEKLGLPRPKIVDAMFHEFCRANDSTEEFTAWNSGENRTFARKEWQFVVEPFHPTSVREDKSPKQWDLKHEYGGNRFPIRLEVFLHAVSATVREESSLRVLRVQIKGDTKFGDYKTAHLRDRQDPLWLHREEVDLVEVVMMRFVKAQLRGSSLENAFDKASRRGIPCRKIEGLASANKLAQDVCATVATVLKAKDGPDSTCTVGDLAAALTGIVTAEEMGALVDHFHTLLAQQKITEAECIGIRMYTGPPYVKFNGVLRDTTDQDQKKGNSYINSIFATGSALRKISGASAIPHGRKLYRGMAGMKLPGKFETASEVGSKGGVEFSFMSTTTKKAVAVSYINASKRRPILFEYDVGSIDRGGSISFMSQYPGEDEVLIPPRSFVEVTGAPFVETVDKDGFQMDITIYPAKINCNLKGQTIEQLVNFKHRELCDMRPYIFQDCLLDWDKVKESVRQDVAHLSGLGRSGSSRLLRTLFGNSQFSRTLSGNSLFSRTLSDTCSVSFADWEERFEAQRKREETTLQELFDMLQEESPGWFNDDVNYKARDFLHVCTRNITGYLYTYACVTHLYTYARVYAIQYQHVVIEIGLCPELVRS